MIDLLSQVIVDKLVSKLAGKLEISILGEKHKRKLKQLIIQSAEDAFNIMKHESPKSKDIDYKSFFISYIKQISNMETNEFAKFILEQDEDSTKTLLSKLKLVDEYDEDKRWCSKCISVFCLTLTKKILDEAMNYESCLYNMVQILNMDIVKTRINLLLKYDVLMMDKIDKILELVDYNNHLDFEMNQGIPGQVKNTTPPKVIIERFLDSYISHDDTIIAYGGREEYTKYLNDWLNDKNSSNYALLTAEAGRGKSALMAHWYLSIDKINGWNAIFIPISIRASFNGCDDIYPFLENQVRKIYHENQIDGHELSDIIDLKQTTNYYCQDNISKILEYLNSINVKVLIIFDGLDEALNDLKIDGFFDTLKSKDNILKSIKIICIARYINDINSIEEWAEEIRFTDYYKMPVLPLLDENSIADILRNTKDPLNKLGDKQDIVRELYRLSEGEPLLIKLYIDELLRIDEENLRVLIPSDLKDIEAGYEGYLNLWISDAIDKKQISSSEVSCILFILGYAKMPINDGEIKQLYRIIRGLPKEAFVDLNNNIRIIKRLLYDTEEGYVLCHPALSIYLKTCKKSRLLELDTRNAVYKGYLEWFKQAFKLLDGTNYDKFPRYLKEQATEHVIDYHKKDNVEFDYYSLLITKQWLKLFYYIDGHYNNYKRSISTCYDYYLIRAKFTELTNDTLNFFISFIIISILNYKNENVPTELYREVMKEKDDSKRVLKEHQIINQIDMFLSEEKKYEVIKSIITYVSKNGLKKITLLVRQMLDTFINLIS